MGLRYGMNACLFIYDVLTNFLCRYYGSLTPLGGLFTVSIDGSTPQRLSNQESVYLEQRMLWSNTSLGPGSHTLTLKPDQNKELCLDFFR